MRRSRLLALGLAPSGAIAASRFFPLAPLRDAVSRQPVAGVHLVFPRGHLALTPFSALADLLTCNSLRQDEAFLAWAGIAVAAAAFLAWRSSRRAAVAARAVAAGFGLLLALAAWTVLLPRPAALLSADDPDLIAVDLHSHTIYSWDGVKLFDPSDNADWHERMGFAAAYITDHNTMAGAEAGRIYNRQQWSRGRRGCILLAGEELSLDGAHIIVLGPRRPIDGRLYQDGMDGIQRLLKDAGPEYGALAIMSLPEYWRFHWDDLGALANAGAKGFEIVTGSPKALEFPSSARDAVTELSRTRGLLAVAASDNHGYGSACCGWNLLKIPGWRFREPDRLESVVLQALSRGPVLAVERTRIEPPAGPWVWWDVPRQLWTMLRTWDGRQAAVSAGWAWLVAALVSL